MFIRVPARLKTSAPGRFQPLLSFSRFTERANLCIIGLLEHYLRRTKDLRSKDSDNLFISFKRPYKPIGVQTISRWIRQTLIDCGVDNFFTAHSTRHASTSFAAKKGISVDLIKKAAGWTADSQVFAKFYDRPIVNSDDFANAVFSN